MKYILLFLIFSQNLFSQNWEDVDYILPLVDIEMIDWQEYEVEMDSVSKCSLIEKLTPKFYEACIITETDYKNYLDKFHVWDFDGDGSLDLIYNGYSLNEGRWLDITLNKKDSAETFISVLGTLVKIDPNNNFTKLIVHKNPCCSIDMNKMTLFKYQNNSTGLEIINESYFYFSDFTEFPEYYNKPFSLKIKSNSYLYNDEGLITTIQNFREFDENTDGYCHFSSKWSNPFVSIYNHQETNYLNSYMEKGSYFFGWLSRKSIIE